MVETRIKLLGIAPYEGMRTVMDRAAQDYPHIQLDVFTGDLELGVAIVQRMTPDSYDCIISRGGTAELIRKVTDMPVVEIQLSVYDVLSAMKLAENYSSRYAIVGFPNITESAHILCDLLGYHLDILTIHGADEAEDMLRKLREEGCRMVVCDMITHTIARKLELDAFLITSGMESLHSAISQAINISTWFGHLRRENLFLRSITQDQNGRAVVLNMAGEIFFSSPADPPAGLTEVLRSHIKEVPSGGSVKFYYTERTQLYRITAQSLLINAERYNLFYCIPSKIPLHSQGAGIRFMNRGECEYLFLNSFYSLSGAMGNMYDEARLVAASRRPVMISGEPGTGKEQIARFLYLNSPLVNNPFVLINCTQINEKSWDFLLNHYNSPLNATGNTIYFQNITDMTEEYILRLLSAIRETGLSRRVRLLFSCVCGEEEPVPEAMRRFCSRLGCVILSLPSLRSRSDEIPSLANLYISSLKTENGNQISGFEPRALEMLRQYDWPNNYTQFKHILQTLAVTTTSAYIRSSMVAELLAQERFLQRSVRQVSTQVDPECTLEEIIGQAIRQAVAAHNGNRAAAARQLGISRTTLWRYLGKEK